MNCNETCYRANATRNVIETLSRNRIHPFVIDTYLCTGCIETIGEVLTDRIREKKEKSVNKYCIANRCGSKCTDSYFLKLRSSYDCIYRASKINV